MNNLIEIKESTVGQETVQTINARELHTFLEVKTSFKDWITRRIQDYEFKEGCDFCSFLSETPKRSSKHGIPSYLTKCGEFFV